MLAFSQGRRILHRSRRRRMLPGEQGAWIRGAVLSRHCDRRGRGMEKAGGLPRLLKTFVFEVVPIGWTVLGGRSSVAIAPASLTGPHATRSLWQWLRVGLSGRCNAQRFASAAMAVLGGCCPLIGMATTGWARAFVAKCARWQLTGLGYRHRAATMVVAGDVEVHELKYNRLRTFRKVPNAKRRATDCVGTPCRTALETGSVERD